MDGKPTTVQLIGQPNLQNLRPIDGATKKDKSKNSWLQWLGFGQLEHEFGNFPASASVNNKVVTYRIDRKTSSVQSESIL